MVAEIEHVSLSSAGQFGEYAPRICALARRQLRIFSSDLARPVYEQQSLLQAVSALARRHRDNEVRILVRDVGAIVERRHKLLELGWRLPSSIFFRVLQADLGDEAGYMIVADQLAVLHQPDVRSDHAYACSNYAPRATSLVLAFDQLWLRAESDMRLRQLVL